MLLVDVANNGTNETTQCHSILRLLETVVPLKAGGRQADIQNFYDRPFCQCVVVKPASDDLEFFLDWYVGEETNDMKTYEDILSTMFNRLHQFYEATGILNERIRSACQKAQYIL
jgi:hypothetical protein